MRHINSLHIGSFRGLRDVKLDQLADVNIFVGRNNSGKTTLLESLAVLANARSPLAWSGIAQRREGRFSPFPGSFLDNIKWLFPQTPEMGPGAYKGRLELSTSGPEFEHRLVSSISEVFGLWPEETADPNSPQASGRFDRQRRGIRIKHQVTRSGSDGQEGSAGDARVYWEDEVHQLVLPLDTLIPMELLVPYSHRIEPAQQGSFSTATQLGRKDQIVALLADIDPSIRGIELLNLTGQRPEIFINHAKAGMIPLKLLGDGIRRAFIIASTIPQVEGGFLLIDEIESAIHYSALNKLFAWLTSACRQFKVQLFVTTHSLEALDAILYENPEHLDQIAGYRIEETDGRQQVRRFDGAMMKRLILDRGLDIR